MAVARRRATTQTLRPRDVVPFPGITVVRGAVVSSEHQAYAARGVVRHSVPVALRRPSTTRAIHPSIAIPLLSVIVAYTCIGPAEEHGYSAACVVYYGVSVTRSWSGTDALHPDTSVPFPRVANTCIGPVSSEQHG